MVLVTITARRLRAALAGALAVAGLVACGGGTSQYEAFVPARLLVFGDEISAISPAGKKYAVNGFSAPAAADGSIVVSANDCLTFPNWVQSMAAHYGFVFAECDPDRVDEHKAIMLANAGAKVADIGTQIDGLITTGGFGSQDLATMLAGANDIVELYQQFPGRTAADLAAEAGARGKLLAQQVNRLVAVGAKVIVANAPDMGLTPYAIRQRAEFGDTDRAALLSRLSAAFNEQLGVNIILDGRFVGLVQADLRLEVMVRNPASYGLANIGDAACLATAPLPDCDTSTLVTGANANTWLWADELRPGYQFQLQIGQLAIDRATRNPF